MGAETGGATSVWLDWAGERWPAHTACVPARRNALWQELRACMVFSAHGRHCRIWEGLTTVIWEEEALSLSSGFQGCRSLAFQKEPPSLPSRARSPQL